jgi:hypothetical protein
MGDLLVDLRRGALNRRLLVVTLQQLEDLHSDRERQIDALASTLRRTLLALWRLPVDDPNTSAP